MIYNKGALFIKGPRSLFYLQYFSQVIEASDVIIEVLDARDPLGCRCPQVRFRLP